MKQANDNVFEHSTTTDIYKRLWHNLDKVKQVNTNDTVFILNMCLRIERWQ